MTHPKLIGFDTETKPIKTGAVFPDIICLQTCEKGKVNLTAFADSNLESAIYDLLDSGDDEDTYLVAHNAKFDLGVLYVNDKSRISKIFELLEAGKIKDTIIREKLLNLADTGNLTFLDLPDGTSARIEYSLSALEKKYMGIDRSDQKEGDDIWRLKYDSLEFTESKNWPDDAVDYAIQDAINVLPIFREQENRRQMIIAQKGIDPFEAEAMRTTADFAFSLITMRGTAVDAEEKRRVEDMLKKELAGDKMKLLIQANILRPEVPARPYLNGAKNDDGTPKVVKAKPSSISKKELKRYCVNAAIGNNEIKFRYNPPAAKNLIDAQDRKRHLDGMSELQLQELAYSLSFEYCRPLESDDPKYLTDFCGRVFGSPKLDTEFFRDFAHLDPVFEEYLHRQRLQKLVTTEIPRMNDPETGETSDIVHPNFDVIKETGRTSSYGGKLYASYNCQNVDPRARNCYVPRPGMVFGSTDYDGMELGTLAQFCLDTLGHSRLAELINEGVDVHAYLGAEMAYEFDEKFWEICEDDKKHETFMSFKNSGVEEAEKFFNDYRTFAKPTDLGYPGGLGAETMVSYAKATYNVVITKEQAEDFKELWLRVFPEMEDYFKHINTQSVDPFNGPVIRKSIDQDGNETERETNLYHYTAPFGFYRAGCNYCPAANGMGLQSPSAVGAIMAVIDVVRACYDPSIDSALYGKAFPVAFIHDEILMEYPESDANELRKEVEKLMISSMRKVTPDVKCSVETALMRSWDKKAKPVFSSDDESKLIVWEPKSEAA